MKNPNGSIKKPITTTTYTFSAHQYFKCRRRRKNKIIENIQHQLKKKKHKKTKAWFFITLQLKNVTVQFGGSADAQNTGGF